MRKIYTLVAAVGLAFGANAQYDLSVSWETLTAGDTYTSSPMDISFSVTNEGDAAIAVGDTVFISYTIGGTPVRVNDLNTTGVSGIILEEEIAPGGTLGPLGFTGAGLPTGFNANICAVVYGLGVESLAAEFEGDDNTDNDVVCVSTNITEGYDVGIEDLELALSNVYVANGDLVIVNDGVINESQANLKIMNMNGQVVQNENFTLTTGTSLVGVNSLARGIYVVAIEVEGAVITRKVSIQ